MANTAQRSFWVDPSGSSVPVYR